MSSLYSLSVEYNKLLNELYDLETGEVNTSVEAQINALQLSTENKCIAVGSYIKNLEAEKNQLEIFQENLDKRKQKYEKAINKFTNDIKMTMEERGISEVKCPIFTIKLKKNPYKTDIIEESLIPEEFINKREIVKVECKPDKEKIKEEVLKTGKQIPGAYVHQQNKLLISIDKV